MNATSVENLPEYFGNREVLPAALYQFSRVYSVSSARGPVTASLIGKEFADYNPLSTCQIGLTTGRSLLPLILGTNLYSGLFWRSE